MRTLVDRQESLNAELKMLDTEAVQLSYVVRDGTIDVTDTDNSASVCAHDEQALVNDTAVGAARTCRTAGTLCAHECEARATALKCSRNGTEKITGRRFA